MWITLAAGFLPITQASTLERFPMLLKANGTWEGVGVAFTVTDGKLGPSQTFTDVWDGTSMMRDRWLVMNGFVGVNGQRQTYRWDFKIDRTATIPTVRATYRNSNGIECSLIGQLPAGSNRLSLAPNPEEKAHPRGIADKARVEIHLFLEGNDIVVESKWLDEKGAVTYQAAARYRHRDERRASLTE